MALPIAPIFLVEVSISLLGLLPALQLMNIRCSGQLTGFLSLDCGSTSNSSYSDTWGIWWTPDTDYIEGGGTATVSKPLGYNDTRYGSLRYFEGKQSRYCYDILGTSPAQIKAGNFYLVRATFWLGPVSNVYETQNGGNGSLQFILIIDSYVAGDVSISFPQTSPLVVEVYMQAQSDSIAVCLSGPGASAGDSNAPFISSLEIRPLPDMMHPVDTITSRKQGLRLLYRINYGSADITRYNADGLDRIWTGKFEEPILSTDHIIDNGVKDLPPVKVLQTAYTPPANWTTGFIFNFTNQITAAESYFYALYFAEIDPNVNASGLRVFDFLVDGVIYDNAIDVYNLTGGDYMCFEHFDIFTALYDYSVFYFRPTSASKLLPFISALELFQILDSPMSTTTYAADAAAVKSIAVSFPTWLGNYNGDPCYPQGYEYSWLSCNTDVSPRVTSILLSNYSLQGEIPSSLNDLTSLTTIILSNNQLNGSIPDLSALVNLEVLDLRNNSLSGGIPESLTYLVSLKQLYLQNNNLSGQVPAALNNLQVFNFTGNSLLCNNTKEACAVSVPPTSSPSDNGGSTKGGTKSQTDLIIGVIVGVIIIIIIIVAIFGTICFLKKKKNKKNLQPRENQEPQQRQVDPNTFINKKNAGIAQVMKVLNMAQAFTSHQLDVATNHYCTKLGEGGSGHVFQGVLDGQLVAVKVIYEYSEQGVKEFTTELGLLSMVHHRNLVQLLGYCAEDNLMLVYEYMPKGSLFDCLHGAHARATPLMWRARLQILVDAANGLDYLHHGCQPQIIHRDIKSSNILISNEIEAKIGDLGISRLRNSGATQTATMLRGTLGYVDPEYASTCNLTEKVDVYSFGVVILETISGRMPINKTNPLEETSIVNWVRPLMDRGIMEEILDGKMGEGYNTHAAWKVLDVAGRCVQYKSADRPSMEEVREELTAALRLDTASDHHLPSEPSTRDFTDVYTNPSLRPR